MGISSAKDLKITAEKLNIYGLGDFGTGKSVFASTFPTPGFVFDFDNRIKTYRGREWDYVTFELSTKGWIEFETTFREVQKLCAQGKYKTVVLDSTTSMTDTAMERALQLDPKRSPEGGAIWNVHYQIVKNLMEPKLHGILNLPSHVIMLGHWKVQVDQKTGAILSVDPLLTGQLAEKVPGYFDEVYAFFTRVMQGKDHFYFRTVSQNLYKARSTLSGRFRLLPDEIPNTYDDLKKHIDKALEKEATRDQAEQQKSA
jgi:hypothetical protein